MNSGGFGRDQSGGTNPRGRGGGFGYVGHRGGGSFGSRQERTAQITRGDTGRNESESQLAGIIGFGNDARHFRTARDTSYGALPERGLGYTPSQTPAFYSRPFNFGGPEAVLPARSIGLNVPTANSSRGMAQTTNPPGFNRGGFSQRDTQFYGPPQVTPIRAPPAQRSAGGYTYRPSHPNEPGPGIFAPNVPAILDARLEDDALQQSLVSRFNTLQLTGDFPYRSNWGTVGTPVKLRANHFALNYQKGQLLWDYSVKIEPAVSVKRIKKRIFALLENSRDFQEFKSHVVHDSAGRLISSVKLPLPDGGIKIPVQFYDEDQDGPPANAKVYNVSVALVNELDTSSLDKHLDGDPSWRNYDPLPIISALNIVVAHHPSRTGIMVGRNRFFFTAPGTSFDLGSGLEAWKGFYSSVRPSFKQLMLNVNVCTTAFYKPGNLAEAMIAFLRGGSGKLNAFVKGVRVETVHLGYKCKKTVKRVGERSPRQEYFNCDEFGGIRISVEQYFSRKYHIELRHPSDLPCVDVGSSPDKPTYLPAEICYITPNQPYRGKLTDEATAGMITHACKPPNINAATIMQQGLPQLGLQSATPLKEFGVTISNQMAVVPGRVLAPPTVTYSHGTVKIDERASWNLRDVKFIRPVPLKNWAVLILRDGGRQDFNGPNDPEFNKVIDGLVVTCRKSGMTPADPKPPVVTCTLPPRDQRVDPTRKAAIEHIRASLGQLRSKPDVVVVMLSGGDKYIYTGLKSLCDLVLDLHTICCHTTKIRKERGQLQYFANIALKLNVKLGGVNHTVDDKSLEWLKQKKTMMFGSDVTHPSPMSLKGTPSIAAVVANVDDSFALYPASLKLQESRKEMITDLSDMVLERLEHYYDVNLCFPDRILFFRDGVSEGQFLSVTKDELPKIKMACLQAAKSKGVPSYHPKVTLCIAGKRHHTRFYPVDNVGADRNGNPRPGTVVDRGVTAIYDFDFFLQAHGGLQGTTRPTHYYVVHDENSFDADLMQQLTNNTSYMFARATRAVSLVPPAYYADLACERGRCYIHELLNAAESGVNVTANTPIGTQPSVQYAGPALPPTSTSPAPPAQANENRVFAEAQRIWGNGVAEGLRKSMFYL
ncbi:hypothetical protein FRC02_010448 [Tulasnella sp. 418]|nr:hypothetical protein FRC02_010448 [Tulasnella sp. 418]